MSIDGSLFTHSARLAHPGNLQSMALDAMQAGPSNSRPRAAAAGMNGPVGPVQRRRRSALTADQRREIAGLLPGLVVHTCVLLFVGCSPAHCDSPWLRAQLPLVVATALLELAAVWAWPALSTPPLRLPRCVAGRLLFCGAPAFRSMGWGLARAVERPPLLGPFGALVDAFRTLIGAPRPTALAAAPVRLLASVPAHPPAGLAAPRACLPGRPPRLPAWPPICLPARHHFAAHHHTLSAGTGVPTIVAQGSYASLPPAGQLVLQLALLALTWKPRAVCASPVRLQWVACMACVRVDRAPRDRGQAQPAPATLVLVPLPLPPPCTPQLLAAPLTRRRVAQAAAALEVLAQPAAWLLPRRYKSGAYLSRDALFREQADSERTCVAVVGYGEALVGLLPVLLAAQRHTWADHAWQPQAPRWLALAWARANAALRWAARVHHLDGKFVLRAWALCALLWLICKVWL